MSYHGPCRCSQTNTWHINDQTSWSMVWDKHVKKIKRQHQIKIERNQLFENYAYFASTVCETFFCMLCVAYNVSAKTPLSTGGWAKRRQFCHTPMRVDLWAVCFSVMRLKRKIESDLEWNNLFKSRVAHAPMIYDMIDNGGQTNKIFCIANSPTENDNNGHERACPSP